jgi:hypothetical protein
MKVDSTNKRMFSDEKTFEFSCPLFARENRLPLT